MQNDLISRKELIERIVNRTGSPTVLFNTTEELNAYLEGCAFKQNDIIDIIDDIPTAYDVEKVVAELEGEDRKANQYRIDAIALHNEEFWRGRQTGLLKAIELIRNGGKE